jgi:hypothetical protein
VAIYTFLALAGRETGCYRDDQILVRALAGLATLMDIPLGNIITAVATVGAVVVANRLSYRRSNRERLWDLRRETYGFLLSELASVEHVCDSIDEAIAERSYAAYWETKSRARDDADIAERMGKVRQRFSDDYLILSDEFIRVFDDLTRESRGDPYNSSPPEEYELFSGAMRKHRPRLLAVAREEMKIKGQMVAT